MLAVRYSPQKVGEDEWVDGFPLPELPGYPAKRRCDSSYERLP